MKKFSPLVLVLLNSFLLFCTSTISMQPQATASQETNFSISNNWRIGLGFAGEYANAEAKLNIQPLTVDRGGGLSKNIQAQQSQAGKRIQIAPCFEVGRGFLDNYYAGILLSWRYSNLRSSIRSPVIEAFYFLHNLRLKHYANLLIKGGYKLAPRMLIYGLIGPSIVNWTHTTRQFNRCNFIDKFSANKTSIGLATGFGLEYLFKKNYAFSLDYIHHFNRATSRTYFVDVTADPMIPSAGYINKKINLSYSTIAFRFTAFFQL